MMTEDEDAEMKERAVFGEIVDNFMKSEIGRYIENRASSLKVEALLSLSTVNAEDAQAVRMLQNDVKVADSVVTWLKNAVADGKKALDILESRE